MRQHVPHDHGKLELVFRKQHPKPTLGLCLFQLQDDTHFEPSLPKWSCRSNQDHKASLLCCLRLTICRYKTEDQLLGRFDLTSRRGLNSNRLAMLVRQALCKDFSLLRAI